MIWDNDKYLYRIGHMCESLIAVCKTEMYEKYKSWSAVNCVVK